MEGETITTEKHHRLIEKGIEILKEKGYSNNEIFVEYNYYYDRSKNPLRIDVAGIKPGRTIAVECGELSCQKFLLLKEFFDEVIYLPYSQIIMTEYGAGKMRTIEKIEKEKIEKIVKEECQKSVEEYSDALFSNITLGQFLEEELRVKKDDYNLLFKVGLNRRLRTLNEADWACILNQIYKLGVEAYKNNSSCEINPFNITQKQIERRLLFDKFFY